MRPLPKLLTPNQLAKLKASTHRAPADETFLLGDEKGGVLVKAITPVLGGNVDSFDPGDIDVVRVPSIRGALRWWWRALQPELSTTVLRTLERKVWGGVGKDSKESACASPVRIVVKVTKRGDVKPAGEHRRNDQGNLRAAADWPGADRLGITHAGYALFPLQHSREELAKVNGSGPMDTKKWRVGLEFELVVSLIERPGHTLSSNERQKVREALLLWLTFGGYGARTRRGFGALHAEKVSHAEARAILARVRSERPRSDRPTLADCTWLEWPAGQPALPQPRRDKQAGRQPSTGGPSPRDATSQGAGRALGVMLAALHEFRQGITFGRKPGQSKTSEHNPRPKNTYGRSRWPEADSFRELAGRHRFRAHPVDDSFRQASAPRAEFGLPIVVKFVTKEDEPANGTVANSSAGGRWASPLIMRPVCVAPNSYRAAVLVLAKYRPTRVRLTLDEPRANRAGEGQQARRAKEPRTQEVDVHYVHATHGGALEDVRGTLQASGSALDAFVDRLEHVKGFERVKGDR